MAGDWIKVVSIHALLAECDRPWRPRRPRRSRFNPRTPCGVRLGQDDAGFHPGHVSIHALLAECDKHGVRVASGIAQFQSTHSLRSATLWDADNPKAILFQSTHSLRSATCFSCFPRSALWRFQSTHSLRSATVLDLSARAPPLVSIHALLAECDCAQPYTLLLNKANHTLRQPP